MALLLKKIPDPCIMRSLKFIWVAVLFVNRCFNSICVAEKKTVKRCCKVLSVGCMKPTFLKSHLNGCHRNHKSKGKAFFKQKKDELK